MSSLVSGSIRRITEHIMEVSASGSYNADYAETTIIYGMSCEKSEDREGLVKLIYGDRIVQFEAPVAVLMDATISVPADDLRKASETASALLTLMAEEVEKKKDPDKWDVGKVGLIQTLVNAIKPMFVFAMPFGLRSQELLTLERWGKYGDEEVRINRPLKCYLRMMKCIEIR